MNAATRILARIHTLALAGAAVVLPALCAAGPPGLAGHRGAPHENAGRTAVLSAVALRPDLRLPAHAQMDLDVPRPGRVDLHEGPPRAADPGAPAGLHAPQGLHWQDASAPISPTLVNLARNYHREGLPLVHLYEADRNMVAIGLNPHGVPGIYFTQKMGR
jgi:hypothetical protein